MTALKTATLAALPNITALKTPTVALLHRETDLGVDSADQIWMCSCTFNTVVDSSSVHSHYKCGSCPSAAYCANTAPKRFRPRYFAALNSNIV